MEFLGIPLSGKLDTMARFQSDLNIPVVQKELKEVHHRRNTFLDTCFVDSGMLGYLDQVPR